MDEQELKHWGILGMKWGVRRYQNEDGSLTPQGRERYGVGVTKNVKGVNDAGSLSDDELYKMTKRYQKQADYYQARNNYIYQEAQYKRNTTPPKKEHTFLKNVFVRPFESFMAKNMEFGYGAIGYALLGGADSDFATSYFNSITGSHLETKDPHKEAMKKKKQELDELELENKIEEQKRTRDNPKYSQKNFELEALKLENELEKQKRIRDNPDYDNHDRDERARSEANYYRNIANSAADKERFYATQKRMEQLIDTKLSDPDFDYDAAMELVKEYRDTYGDSYPVYDPNEDYSKYIGKGKGNK